MSVIRKCDRCGRDISPTYNGGYAQINQPSFVEIKSFNYGNQNYDFCFECSQGIIERLIKKIKNYVSDWKP